MLKDLGIDIDIAEIASVKEVLDKSFRLVDWLLCANRKSESLEALQIQTASNSTEFVLDNRLLLYTGQLVVLQVDNLSTDLIKEAYNQVSTAYSGQDKTYYLLWPWYYWLWIKADIKRFVWNCYTC